MEEASAALLDVVLAADEPLDVASVDVMLPEGGAPGGGPGGSADKSLPSSPKLLMNEARSADSVDVLPLLVAVLVTAAALVVSDVAVVPVLAVPPDCRLTKKDCKSAINWEASDASLESVLSVASALVDAEVGGGPGGGGN